MDKSKESWMQQGEPRMFAGVRQGRRLACARRGGTSARARPRAGLLLSLLLACTMLGTALPQAAGAAGVFSGGLGFSFTPSKTEPYAVCGRATPGHSACLAILVPTAAAESSAAARSLTFAPQTASPQLLSPSFTGSGVGGGYDPADLRSAYDLSSESAGSGQTVAVVDAFDDPDAESDLGVYRSRYGLPACTSANGCFKKVNQLGETKNYPAGEPGWAVEISLDLDMVSAACSNCHILLVEAESNSDANLYKSEDEAATLGATEISNSWGGEETSSETSYDTYFHHTGVLVTASAGDSGYRVSYPAASQYVISVGGTALTQASNSRGWTESVWGETTKKGTGSGCSAYETKPAWQTDSGCTRRTDNDIAAVASPATPVSLADSYELPKEFSKPEAGWTLAGGTSASSPFIAGTMALANAYTKSFSGADALYLEAAQNGTGVLDDVTSGLNGTCGNYLCEGLPGYDGPSGLGSPYGAPIVLPSPTVVTKAATSVTQTTATLNATVNPNGGEVTECRFEYGATTSYGSTAPCTSLPGSGSSPVAVSAALTGLVPNTTYHLRISATSAGGTSKGSDETFKALPEPTYATSITHYENPEIKFSEPSSVAVDPSGDIFAADPGHERIVEFNSERKYLRQFGEEGSGSGQFKGIGGIAANASGDLYVSDAGNNRVEEFGPSGEYLRSFGSSVVTGGQLLYPGAIAIDSEGNVWVLNPYGASEGGRIVEFSSTGTLISKFGSTGTSEGTLGIAYGLAFSGGHLYVSEFQNSRVQEFSTKGEYLGQFDPLGSGTGKSNEPWGLASEPTSGNLYVSEVGSDRVQEFSPAGAFIATFGSAGSGSGQLQNPRGVAVGPTGKIFIADTGNNRIEEWAHGSPPTYATSITHYENPEIKFSEPSSVAVDPSGDIFAADPGHERIVEFNSERKYLRQFGEEGSGSGQFKGIGGIAANASGDLYVSDAGNNRVEEFGPSGEYLRSFGSSVVTGGQLLYPGAIAIDSEGNVWVLNPYGASEGGRIVEFSSTGTLISKFGSTGTSEGTLGIAYGLAFSGGHLYVSEFQNSRVQEFSTKGEYLGQFDPLGSGTGKSNEPWGLASEPTSGNLYVSEVGSDRVQEFSPAGAFIATFGSAGSGSGQLQNPRGVAVGPTGKIFIADTGNNRIEEWAP